MKSFSFIHTADLHLDSPFSGLHRVDGRMASLLREATFRAFENVLELALRERVDFLLVAGDVYDGADRSLRAQLRFNAGLKRLADAGTPSFVCHGNHDPLDGWTASLHWPDTVHIFGSTLESVVVPVGGENLVRVHGISYPQAQIDASFGKGFQRRGPEPFQIGLFHCSVGSNPAHETYAPRTLEELQGADLDYWALGHVHRHQVLGDGHPFVLYPGNIQGRHIREPGPRGCLLVRVDGHGEVSIRFEPVDAVRWLSREVDISDLESEGDLLLALERLCEDARLEAQQRPAIVRLALSGRGVLHQTLRRPGVGEDLTERLRETGLEGDTPVWVERILVRTGPPIDLKARRQAADFLGETLRVVDRYRRQPEELIPFLAELYEDRRGCRALEKPGREELLELIGNAENICLEELLDEETE
jgi:exonuclease SbcD